MKEPLGTVTGAGHRLGEYIREQRRGNQISVRQLAALAEISNPYLSQIERGLRKPSAEILQQIAKGLRISAEALYLQAGILEHREGDRPVVEAVLSDAALSERQKQVLLEIYDSFRKENAAAGTTPVTPEPHDAPRRRAAGDAGPAGNAQPGKTAQPGNAQPGKTARPTKTAQSTRTARPAKPARTGTTPETRTPTPPQEART